MRCIDQSQKAESEASIGLGNGLGPRPLLCLKDRDRSRFLRDRSRFLRDRSRLDTCLRAYRGLLAHRGSCRWIFFLQRPAPIQNGTPNQILGTPTFGSQNRPIKMPLTYLSPFQRFCRLGTCQGYQPIPSCHFTMLTQSCCIVSFSFIKSASDRPRGVIFLDLRPSL